MKTIKSLKLAIVITLSILCFNCSTEPVNIESSVTKTEFKKNVEKDGCEKGETLRIFVLYDFPYNVMPNGSIFTIDDAAQAVIKNNFYLELTSNNVMICKIHESNCDNVETIIVNATQYNDFINSGGLPGVGTGNNVVVEGPGTMWPTWYTECN